MFVRTNKNTCTMLTIHFEDQPLTVRAHLNVAAALLETGIGQFRETPVSASPRAPFCMMGVCFDCLLVIDGVANQQACMTKVRDGMKIERQSGAADALRYDASAQESES